MHAICAAQYAGSHLCHMAEYGLANSATIVPAGGAWTDGSAFTGSTSHVVTLQTAMPLAGRYTQADSAYNCVNWTNASAASRTARSPTPGAAGTPTCNVARNRSRAA